MAEQTAGLNVEIRDNTRKGAISAGRSFDKIKKDATQARSSLGRFEKKTEKTGDQADGPQHGYRRRLRDVHPAIENGWRGGGRI